MPLGVIIPGGSAVFRMIAPECRPVRQDAGRPETQEEETMANTSSAKKAARQMITRTAVNKARRTRVKSDVRSVEEAIASGDRAKAEAALKAAQALPVRTAQKGMMHKKTASRKVSRLTKRVKAMSA